MENGQFVMHSQRLIEPGDFPARHVVQWHNKMYAQTFVHVSLWWIWFDESLECCVEDINKIREFNRPKHKRASEQGMADEILCVCVCMCVTVCLHKKAQL